MANKDEKGNLAGLRKYYDVVSACNRCGFCTSYCPTYNATGSESHSPRGRNQAFRALIEGRLSNPLQTKEIIDTCVLCGECTSVCFSEVPTASLMIQARHALNQSYGLPWGLKFMLFKILPNPKLFRRVLKFAFLGKKLGVAFILRKLGLLKRLAPSLHAADQLGIKVPWKFFLDYKQTNPYQDKQLEKEQHAILVAQKKMFELKKKKKKIPEWLERDAQRRPQHAQVAFLPVCGSQYIRPSISLATLKLFELLKVDMRIPDGFCCGLPAASYGALDRVQFFARRNIETIQAGGYDQFIVDDSSCMAHFKDYPQYFRDDPVWFEKAHAFVQKVRDLPQFYIRSGLEKILSTKVWNKGPVAFHDPCKAQYAQKIVEPPRQLIRSIRNMKMVDVFESDQCCGGGGTYSFVHPEISQEILAKKVEHIAASGAKTVVTSSASCLIQLVSGLKKHPAKIKVLHLSEFLINVIEGKS